MRALEQCPHALYEPFARRAEGGRLWFVRESIQTKGPAAWADAWTGDPQSFRSYAVAAAWVGLTIGGSLIGLATVTTDATALFWGFVAAGVGALFARVVA